MIQRYDLAPLDGITKVVFRRVWNRHFGGADRCFIPFFSPTDHHVVTARDFRELDPDQNRDLPSVPQVMSCKAPDFLWAAEVLGEDIGKLKLTVCHLGNGSSVSAVKYGKSVDTSMGLTPLEGLIMGTRSGDLDPAIIEFIAHKEGKSLEEVMQILNKESGVLGLSDQFSSDFRDLEDSYQQGKPEGTRAMKAFAYRVAKYIGAYTAAMNGVDGDDGSLDAALAADLGINSLELAELVLVVEDQLGVEVNEDDLHRFITVGDVVDYLEELSK